MKVFYWHAAIMLLCWLILVPAGVLTARYFKVTRAQNYPAQLDNKFWWHWHLRLQYSAWVLMNLAFGLIVSIRWDGDVSSLAGALWPSGLHGWFGIIALLFAWGQIFSGWLRGSRGGPPAGWQVQLASFDASTAPPGDHYDMTPRRHRFEAWHKLGGYLAWFSAVVAGQTGLWLLQAPVWAFALHGLACVIPALLFVHFARQKRWLPTYQAIWGPDRRHPGNKPTVSGRLS
jgi:succinate dehydrogenase/fumarate reductase cytochrome b subunit